ncbi:major facilitator superfamily domain-containing protein [Melanogaster broomeanus]|nr:major facilitator superfamily domain-containing protein [Melanogaster broomeanus]
MSHSRNHRDTSVESQRTSYIPQPGPTFFPDGTLDERAAEVLHDYVHPHQQEAYTLLGEDMDSPVTDDEEEDDHVVEVASWKRLPWWKRPSPYWLVFGIPIGSIGFSATFAPRVAMYTSLACRVHMPEIVSSGLSSPYPWSTTNAADILPLPHGLDGNGDTMVDHSPQKCASDPVVQAVVARLTAVLTTTMGILSCLTAGWWGSLSDRYGRRRVIAVSMFGLLVTDITFIITAYFVDVLPGGYWFLLVGFVIEGLCGSMPAGVAADHAYLADTTEPSTRSRYFSLSLGFMFTGVAVGPIIGGILIRLTGNTLSVFYLATALHAIYTLLAFFVLPESLTRARARGAHLRHNKEMANRVDSGRALRVYKGATNFLTPLIVLLPERILDGNPLKRSRRDWSLFLIAASYGLNTTVFGSINYKFQYAAAIFKWTPEISSYYVSSVGTVRALFLAVLLPLIIKYLYPTSVQLPSTPDEPLRGSIGLSPARGSRSHSRSPHPDSATHRSPTPSHSPTFDLALARVSLVLELISFLIMAVAATGALFTFGTMIGSFGAGFSPAVQALALEIYAKRGRGEGKLFGALSVIQSLGSQIIGPALYGFVYFNTVATFPAAIMVVSVLTSMLAFVLLAFVRIPSGPGGDDLIAESGDHVNGTGEEMQVPEILVTREDTLVDGH